MKEKGWELKKLLNKIKELIAVFKMFFKFKMDKMNKMNLYCIKFQKAIDDSISIELTFQIDRITRLYFNCICCCFKNFTAIDKEDLNNDLEELRVKVKLSYYSFKNFRKRLNKRNLINLLKRIGYKGLIKIKRSKIMYQKN